MDYPQIVNYDIKNDIADDFDSFISDMIEYMKDEDVVELGGVCTFISDKFDEFNYVAHSTINCDGHECSSCPWSTIQFESDSVGIINDLKEQMNGYGITTKLDKLRL